MLWTCSSRAVGYGLKGKIWACVTLKKGIQKCWLEVSDPINRGWLPEARDWGQCQKGPAEINIAHLRKLLVGFPNRGISENAQHGLWEKWPTFGFCHNRGLHYNCPIQVRIVVFFTLLHYPILILTRNPWRVRDWWMGGEKEKEVKEESREIVLKPTVSLFLLLDFLQQVWVGEREI